MGPAYSGGCCRRDLRLCGVRMKCHYCKRKGRYTFDIGIIISVCVNHIAKAARKEKKYLAAENARVRNEALKQLKPL